MAIFVLFIEGCNAVIFLIFAQCIPSLLPFDFLGVGGNVADGTDRNHHLRIVCIWVYVCNSYHRILRRSIISSPIYESCTKVSKA